MAIGNVTRIPRISSSGKITVSRTVINENGDMVSITEEIFPTERRTVDGRVSHIVNISDQLSSGKYTYNIVNNSGQPVSASSIFRVFLSGVNLSSEVTLSEDGKSFTFSEDCNESLFSSGEVLIIDFEEL